VQITIDTNNLSELDINMLAFLADAGEVVEEEVEEPVAVPAPKPAKAKAEPAPEPEPEPEEELIEVGDAPTMSDAVAAATTLVSEGGAAKVKSALAIVGAKRVSEMAEGDIPAFLAALEAE